MPTPLDLQSLPTAEFIIHLGSTGSVSANLLGGDAVRHVEAEGTTYLETCSTKPQTQTLNRVGAGS